MIGTLLKGRYTLTAEIGRGSMGAVYRAHDTLLDRDVAVKVISASSLDDAARRRFFREARAAARLSHPNIVALHDAGTAGDEAFLVMELVEGKNLRSLLPVRLDEALEVARQLCRALAHAHGQGIVHRDIKPENLLARRTEQGLVVKLMDFGLALAEGQSRLTREGTVLGTLAYIAPEQALGGRVDGRTDLYALGAMLYELTTGRVPFGGGTPQVVIAQHLKSEPVPPRTHDPEIPAAVEAIILRLLAKKPEERFATADEVDSALAAVAGSSPVTGSSPPRARPAIAGLSGQPTELIGRDREIREVCALLLSEDVRLLTLTGAGGTGKTRLAADAARVLIPEFADGVAFVSLGTLADPGRLFAAVAECLEVQEEAGLSLEEALLRHLRNRRMLLVLDNFEQLLPAAPRVAELLAACPELRILVTSRERLRAQAERELEVPPLALPPRGGEMSARTVSASASAALFARRAREVRPDFELTDANAAAVADICHRLDGLPLALELAATRIKLLAPAAMAAELARIPGGSALPLLGGGAADLPARQRTLRGAISWSHDLLDAREKELFRSLAVFSGSFSLEALRAVCPRPEQDDGGLLDTFSSLLDKNLVRRSEESEEEARFRMLETIREYAQEKLSESGALGSLRGRHLEYFVALAERAEPELRGPRQAQALHRLQRDLPNFRLALDHAVDSGNSSACLRLAVALRWFWAMRGHAGEARRWIELGLEASQGEQTSPRAQALHVAGLFAEIQGELPEARRRFHECIDLARAIGDDLSLAKGLGSLGEAWLGSGEYKEARSRLQEALALRRKQGNRAGEGATLLCLSDAAFGLGNYDEATRCSEEGLAVMRETGNRHHESQTLSRLGRIAVLRREFETAERLIREGLAIQRELNDAHCSGTSLNQLGRISLLRGLRAEAVALYREALTLLAQPGARAEMAESLEGLAELAAADDDLEAAAELLGAAEALREATGAILYPPERRWREELADDLGRRMRPEELLAARARGRGRKLEAMISRTPSF